MENLDMLEWIIEEWVEKCRYSQNSYDNGKTTAYTNVLKEIKDLRAREKQGFLEKV